MLPNDVSDGNSVRSYSIHRTLLERTSVTTWLRHTRSIQSVRGYPLLGPVQLAHLKMVIIDAVHMSHVLCGNAGKDVSSRGLELVHCWGLFRKCHLDVLHLLCAQNVTRLAGVRQRRVVGDGSRETSHRNVIVVCNDREIHTNSGRLLVLGGWLGGRGRSWHDWLRLGLCLSFRLWLKRSIL